MKNLELLKGRHSQTWKIQTEARRILNSHCVGMLTGVSTGGTFTPTVTYLSIKGLCIAAVLGHLPPII